MKAPGRDYQGRSGLDLIEEAVHLLRRGSGAVLAGYYLGTLPFILGLLYFWADMSRNPFAGLHLAGASLALALGFLWMKLWQSVFATRIRAQISGMAAEPWNFRRCLRVCVVQATIQSTAVFVLPLAFLALAIPLGWVYAFYANMTVLGTGETGEFTTVAKKAWQQSLLWPGQNHVILASLAAFGGCVFLNLTSVCLALPRLLKMLFDVDSVYSQSPAALLNTTFFATMLSLAWLCVDPILKTVYVLRCFYGESLTSGEDLKAGLQQFSGAARSAFTGLVLLLALSRANSSRAAAEADRPAPRPPAVAIETSDLDRAIDEVIRQPKYAWRLPRGEVSPDALPEGRIARFLHEVGTWIKECLRTVWHWLRDLLDRLFKRRSASAGHGSGLDWISPLQALVFVLLAVVAGALGVLLYRAWKERQSGPVVAASEAILPVPDLADENLGADQLAEDGWIGLGRELLARDEMRLALRAFYFASLAHLARRNLITIAKFKSNRDYERELGRRGHSLPGVVSLFGANVTTFERSWYGRHGVTPELIGQFVSNVERIKAP